MSANPFTFTIRNGLTITFEHKPPANIRDIMKRNGFRWSPAGGSWYRSRVAGAADFVDALRAAYNPPGTRPAPVGACWRCQSPAGYFRPKGAASPVLCDDCHALDREHDREEQEHAAARTATDRAIAHNLDMTLSEFWELDDADRGEHRDAYRDATEQARESGSLARAEAYGR